MNNVVKLAIGFLAVGTVLLVDQASAESIGEGGTARDPGVNARQHSQNHRIRQGVRSGELTRSETQQLNAERRGIRSQERAAKADGQVTRSERKTLHQDLHQLSQDIYQDKHNDQQRPNVGAR